MLDTLALYSIYDRTFWLGFWLGIGAASVVWWFLWAVFGRDE